MQPSQQAATQLEQRCQRMQRSLEALAAAGDSALLWSTAISVVGGGAVLAYGAWVAVDGGGLPQNAQRTALSATMLTLGGLLFASGVRDVAGLTTTDQERLSRWHKERALAGPDAITLARYEGELRAEAAIARQIRTLDGVAFIGTASAGAGVLALAITAQFTGSARTAAWFWGGALFVTGVWQAIASLAGESRSERVWNAYRTGARDPGAAIAHITLTPAVARGAFALRLSGRF
jgi:hypothetical protein